MSKDKYKDIFKIIVLGAAGVGKTTLIEQFSDESLHKDAAPKVGVNFFIKSVKIDEICAKFPNNCCRPYSFDVGTGHAGGTGSGDEVYWVVAPER